VCANRDRSARQFWAARRPRALVPRARADAAPSGLGEQLEVTSSVSPPAGTLPRHHRFSCHIAGCENWGRAPPGLKARCRQRGDLVRRATQCGRADLRSAPTRAAGRRWAHESTSSSWSCRRRLRPRSVNPRPGLQRRTEHRRAKFVRPRRTRRLRFPSPQRQAGARTSSRGPHPCRLSPTSGLLSTTRGVVAFSQPTAPAASARWIVRWQRFFDAAEIGARPSARLRSGRRPALIQAPRDGRCPRGPMGPRGRFVEQQASPDRGATWGESPGRALSGP